MKIKLNVKDLTGKILQSATFNDQKSLDDFVETLKQGAWGKPEHQELVSDEVINPDGTITPAVYKIIPSEYTIETTDITAEVEDENRKVSLKESGKKAREACQNVLDLIGGYNISRALTADQINQMTTQFSPIVQLLTISRPTAAKQLITAITPDGVLVTDQMKADILIELEGF